MTAPTAFPPPAPSPSGGPPGQSAAARRLDESIMVTRPTAWLGLAAVGVLIAAAVVAACVLHVPKVVTVPATVTFPGGRLTVPVTAPGTVQQVLVDVGAVVAPGDQLVTVRDATGATVTLVAPESATVLSVPVTIGQVLKAGDAVAELARWLVGSDAAVVGFVSLGQEGDFPPGSTVDVLLRDGVYTGTVARMSLVRVPLVSVSEVVGDDTLAQGVYERTGGSPLAVTVVSDAATWPDGAASPSIPAGTAVVLRRVVSDPTVWSLLFGGGG